MTAPGDAPSAYPETCGRGILLDIEGTMSSIRFVYDVLFPFARQHVAPFLAQHWDDAAVVRSRELIARDAGAPSFADWTIATSLAAAHAKLVGEIHRLMDADAKTTGLKDLQGLIWRGGYESGALLSHVYDDVPPALAAWADRGIDIRIYSSGSVAAQKLFFRYTQTGDLTPYFSGYYDTTTGPKREPASYCAIADDMKSPAMSVLFVSDVLAELDAARAAGMRTALMSRPENAQVASAHAHPVIADLRAIEFD